MSIKIKRAWSVSRLRRNILFMVKGDTYFYKTAQPKTDMFFHIWDSITQSVPDYRFYVAYSNDLPIAYVCTSKQTKQFWFYVDVAYRTKQIITELFGFVKRKIGNEFRTGTKKTNEKFIRFAETNGWVVCEEDENKIIFKGEF